MRALIADAQSTSGLTLGSYEPPQRKDHELLIQVAATSINFGEVHAAMNGGSDGKVLGWDAAGTVLETPDAKIFPVGSRVLSRGADGGWAELRSADLSECAIIPDAIDFGIAASLPVAAGTALRALRVSGNILGKKVLITGASGGVGRYGIQLATLGGAHVIASVGSERRRAGLKELGAHEVVIGLEGVADVDIVLDSVGGHQLVQLYGLLNPQGVIQSIGWTSMEPAVFPPYSTVGPAKSLVSFSMGAALGTDLAYLLSLITSNLLVPQIGWRGDWTTVDEAITLMINRQLDGKAVLDVS